MAVEPFGNTKDKARYVKSDGQRHSFSRREVGSVDETGPSRFGRWAVRWPHSAGLPGVHLSASRRVLPVRRSTIMLAMNTGSKVTW
jgi:hypothetical protein